MASGRASRKISIIAGPNGAGKTVFATEYLPREGECLNFVNADLIAAGMSPFRPSAAVNIRASRAMLHLIRDHARNGRSFAFETTLSGRGWIRRIPRWQARGYTVRLIYLRLRDPELAIARVRQRVSEGGHDVPEAVIRRRLAAGWTNFRTIYRELVDEWIAYDNSGERPRRIDGGCR